MTATEATEPAEATDEVRRPPRRRRRRPWRLRAVVVLLLAAVVATVGATVSIDAGRRDEAEDYVRGHRRALTALDEVPVMVLTAVDERLAQSAEDNTALLDDLLAVDDGLRAIELPASDRYPRSSGSLVTVVDRDHEMVRILAVAISQPVLETDESDLGAVRAAIDQAAAALGAAHEVIDDPPAEPDHELSDATSTLLARFLDEAEELRAAQDQATAVESERQPRRQELQAYYDEAYPILARYDTARADLEAAAPGEMIIDSDAAELAYEMTMDEAAEARYALASELRSVRPPPVLAERHRALVRLMDRAGEAVENASYGAYEAYCYPDDEFSDPCEPVRTTDGYREFERDGNRIGAQYDQDRLGWTITYESELRALYG